MLKLCRKLAALAILALPLAAHAANYPSKPVRIIVPYTNGGTLDLQTRLYADALSKMWGVSVVVDNRPGASGIIGTDAVAKAAPDGYTIGIVSGQHSTLPPLFPELPFKFSDLKTVAILTQVPMALLARPDFPANNVKELIEHAKTNPGEVNAGTAGPATMNNIWLKSFEEATDTKFMAVPFRGSGPAHIDLMAGRIDIMFDAAGAVLPNIKAGRLKVLAVGGTGSELLPDVPSLASQGYPIGATMFSPSAAVVPAATPNETVEKLSKDFLAVLQQPDIRKRLLDAGLEVIGKDSDEADKFISSEVERLTKIIRDNNITTQ